MDSVFYLIKLVLKISDARNGIGTIKNVSNVQPDGFSVPMELVFQLTTDVLHLMLREHVLLVTKDTT